MSGKALGMSHLFSTQAVYQTAREALKITLLQFLASLWACTYSICFSTHNLGASCSYLHHNIPFLHLTGHQSKKKTNKKNTNLISRI